MGTKVQYKSYSPAYYSMSNLKMNADVGSWSRCYEDMNLTSGHYFDHLLRRPTDGYSVRDMEELKQAMLKHEVIFRNQVYELHRLYGIQKDFMDKLKRKELQKHQVAVEASQSSPFSSQIPSEDFQKLWMIPGSQLASSCSGSSTLDFVNMQSPMSFSKEISMQISPVRTHNTHSLMKCESLESTSKKCPVKKIDLQLPVDEYLASEEARQMEKEKVARLIVEENHSLKRYCRTAPENDARDGDPCCQEDASISQLDTERKCGLIDLNEELLDEEATIGAVDFLDSVSCNRENQGKNICSKPNSVFVGLSMDYLQNTWGGRDNTMYTNIQPLENKGNKQDMDMRAQQSDSCPGSSFVSSWIKPKRIPCVNPSALLNKSPTLSIPSLGSEEEKWHYSTKSRSTSSVESEVSQQNELFHELHSQPSLSHNHYQSVGFDYNCCDKSASSGDIYNHNAADYLRVPTFMDVKSAKGMDLNLPHPSGLQVGIGTDVKNEEAPRRSSKLRMKPTFNDGTSKERDASKQMGIEFLHGSSQHSTCKAGIEKLLTASSTPNFTSASRALNYDFQMIGMGDHPNTGSTLGFPSVTKPIVSEDQLSLGSLSNSLQYPSQAVEALNSSRVGKIHTDLSYDLAKSHSGQQLSNSVVVDKGFTMDFSDCANHHSSNSCTKEEKALPKSTIREIIEIDLEVPAEPDSLEGVSTGEDSLRNQHEKLIQSSEGRKEMPQELVKLAAEALVVISSAGNHDCLEDASCPSLESSVRDPLHWFAKVITSVTSDRESKMCVDDDKLPPAMDYFESMTLKLTETKVDEYCSKLVMPEYPEVVTNASSLMTQRCRGKGRRGGQQRNFQRDILPGFVSLSKHEVSEDLEMLEGLMRSVGHSWQIGLSRRTAARTGRARGKGRSRGSNLIPAVSAV